MSELKGNDNQKQKASQPCTHVYFCNKSVSARNGCYRISSVWGWKVISHLVFISHLRKVRDVGVTQQKRLRHTPDMDIHANRFSTASNSTLYGSVPYMETLPVSGREGCCLETT